MPAEITVDPEAVKAAASIQCTFDEAAAIIGCSKRTLLRKFKEDDARAAAEIAAGLPEESIAPTLRDLWEEGQAHGRASLRRRMVETSRLVGKNARTAALMQIHLSKHWLGMHDRTELTGPGGSAIPIGDAGKMDPAKLRELPADELAKLYTERVGVDDKAK